MKKRFILSIMLILTLAFSACFVACDNGVNVPPQDSIELPEVGERVAFGSYPQTDVTAEKGEELTAVYATVLPYDGNLNGWTSYGYYANGSNDEEDFMWYLDVDTDANGVRDYRAVYFEKYRPLYTTAEAKAELSANPSQDSSYQHRNGYDTEMVYWFKYEPIYWHVLSVENNKVTLFAESAIDCRDIYHSQDDRDGGQVVANNYAQSDIRAWLNGAFFETAFNQIEKALIGTTVVDNSARSANPDENENYYFGGTNQYACDNTDDKVFLLSVRQVTMADYRFNVNSAEGDVARKVMPTDYAKCQGVDVPITSNNIYACWWLRSPFAMQSYNVMYIDQNGIINGMPGDFVNRTNYGIVPAIQLEYPQ